MAPEPPVAWGAPVSLLSARGDLLTSRIAKPFGILAAVFVGLACASYCNAADKHARAIGLYDLTVHFNDPSVNGQAIGDAFVKQFLVDNSTNACIRPSYLPQRFLGNSESQTVGGQDASGLDYLAFGDLYKEPGGYRIDANLVTGKDRQVVLKYSGQTFTDLKEAVWKAQMAALNLRLVGSGAGSSTHSLADLILDFEKKQRERFPKDHAIAPELKAKLAESDRYPLKLKPAEKRDISFTLMDCDGVADKGAEVLEETILGDVTPAPVTVAGDGSGKFTYTAPRKNASGSIRVGFSYDRGSGHAGNPEFDTIDLQIGAERLSFRTVVDVKIQNSGLQHSETHHSDAVYTPYTGSDANCTTALAVGYTCKFMISTLNATASARFPNGSHAASSNKAGNAVEAQITRLAKGATLQLSGPEFASMSPDEDDEHYIGICIDQGWQPMLFTLSEEEFNHFSTIQKSLSISSPMGVNNCTGSGTLILTGQK